ncbi:A-kinase anchor protein 12b isoform X2 [Brachyhypopomus gauderio]|uniref:A-kinase anchor protein 12b isoform X2 n=1 Tax=Brachyhypopomus gauderio TaxID=698409 RepID=UPI004041B07F
MGAATSVQRDAKSAEDATTDEQCTEVNETRDSEIVDEKLQKNGQISVSSLNGKMDEETDFNGLSEDSTLAEVGQTDATPEKEDSPETIEELQDEVSPQVNGEQEESECVKADTITAIEEETVQEKPNEANEVGFKKIFRFVGFKFTLKKDKNEKTEPVQLLTVKETEDGASEATAVESKEETVEAKPEEENISDVQETEKEATAEDTAIAEAPADLPETDAQAETLTDGAAAPEQTPTEQPAEEVAKAPEKESEEQAESPTSPASQEVQSSFKRFFTQGIFSNLRKKTSFKKPKEEETVKEKSVEEDIKETDEKAEDVAAGNEQVKEDGEEAAADKQVDEAAGPEEIKPEASPEEASSTTEEAKEEEPKVQATTASEIDATPVAESLVQTCEDASTLVDGSSEEAKSTDDAKHAGDKSSDSTEGQQSSDKSPTTTEAEVPLPQDKVKAQGSPLKKLFTGAGLKKLSKKQKVKKEAESKVAETGEQTVEQIQSSTESAEAQKTDSGPSSPEESAEHAVEEASQAEAAEAVEAGEAVTSDNEKKKEGILPWASFKKLVTPKKHVKRSSESEDETPGDKPKSATLSSTESAVLDDKTEETKPSDEVTEEPKEESQIESESKTETKAEKAEQSTEEPKRKMDTSVSWETFICVGSAKKRARKTSDSDDEETKIDEEVQQSGEDHAKTAESPLTSSQEAEHENVASSPEPEGELVSTWESFKRLVTHRKKPKAEDKSDDASAPEQTTSDSEIPKEESSFSLKKLIPRRKKKSAKQGQVSSDVGSAEEDSDTPAVVPLSEYENDQPEKEVAKEVTTDETTTDVTPVTPKVSAEDRSPSWISATVEDIEDEARGKQLSDIPEEGDTAATPKSTDNTIAEDIVDFTSEAVTALEPVEETEMVSAMSRITASPVTSGDTTPVPEDETVLQEAVETICASATAVTVTEEQKTTIPASSSTPQVESTIKDEKVDLVAHEKSEATAICTGLDTSEIKGVEQESPLKASVESVTAVSKALSMEITVEEQLKPEEAGVTQDSVFKALVNEIQTEYKEEPHVSVENAIEKTVEVEAVKETSKTETVDEFQQATAVKVAVVSAVQQEAEILEEPLVSVQSPKVEAEGPIEPTLEESVCAQTAEVTETAVSEREKVVEVKDVHESVSEPTESTEDTTPVTAPTKESEVTEEIIFVSPTSESKIEVEVKNETIINEVTVLVTTGDVEIQDSAKEIVSTNIVVEGHVECALSNISPVVEEVCGKVEEEIKVSHAVDVKEEETIQEQSTVIVQEVIQNVVENLGELNIGQSPEEPLVELKSCTNVAEEATKPSASEKVEVEITTSISTVEEKIGTDVPAAGIAVPEEKPLEDVPVHENKEEEEKPIEDTQVQESKLPTESMSDKPVTPETDDRAEINAQQEEVITVSTDALQEGTDVIKKEVNLEEVGKNAEDEQTKPEERKGGAEKDLKEEQTEIQKVSPDTPASDESHETRETSPVGSTMQAQVIVEQCQVIQTTMENNVGLEDVVDAVEETVKDTETTMKEDKSENQEPLEDRPQTVLDEAQKDISTQDMKGQEGSGDTSEAKVAVKENAIKEEVATQEEERKIDPVSTETATVS